MRKAYATIQLYDESAGGRESPIPAIKYKCPLFFIHEGNVATQGCDCRILLDEYGRGIDFGETLDKVPLVFLSPENVFNNIQIGTEFYIWEMGFIGQGVISFIQPS